MTDPAATFLPDSPRAQAVLHRRAVRLANEAERGDTTPRGELFLAVRLGPRERYGLPYRWLDEIVRPHGLTTVPGAPAFVAGVMARRGRLIAVLDLARLLDIDRDVDGEETRVVMVSAAGYSLGLRVDEILTNDRFDAETLAPALAGSNPRGWITGIHAGELSMLDLEALLGDPQIRIEERP